MIILLELFFESLLIEKIFLLFFATGSLSATRSKGIHRVDIPLLDWPAADFPMLKYPLHEHEAENREIENRALESVRKSTKKLNIFL